MENCTLEMVTASSNSKDLGIQHQAFQCTMPSCILVQGTMPSCILVRGTMPSYILVQGTMPSYCLRYQYCLKFPHTLRITQIHPLNYGNPTNLPGCLLQTLPTLLVYCVPSSYPTLHAPLNAHDTSMPWQCPILH